MGVDPVKIEEGHSVVKGGEIWELKSDFFYRESKLLRRQTEEVKNTF